jgi:hypothetical protein
MRCDRNTDSNTEWVTKTTVRPLCRQSRRRSPFRRCRVISSRAANGSSISSSLGCTTRARASETRIFMPPDSSRGQTRSNPLRPTLSRAATARASRSLLVMPRSLSGRATLASAVAHGIRVGSWKTKPRSVPASPLAHSIEPPVGRVRPAISRSSVDFPHPDGPSTLRNSPSSTSSETPERASTPLA